jgi:hypothetical protein
MDRTDRQRPHAGLLSASTEPAIDGAYVDAIARRVVELIHTDDQADIGRRFVDAATLAGELGVERSWVYEHARELHAIRLGSGPRARLRFNPPAVRAVLDRQAPDLPPATANAGRPTSASGVRRTRSKSRAGRVLTVRPRGAS